MLLMENNDGAVNAVATGILVGRYKVTKAKNGLDMCIFTICYDFDKRLNEHKQIKVVWTSSDALSIMKHVKENKTRLAVFGKAVIDRDLSTAYEKKWIIYSFDVFIPSMLMEMYLWHQGAIKFDKEIEKRVRNASDIRYDYEIAEKPEDHMI